MPGTPRHRKSDLPRDGLGRLRSPGAPDEMAHLRGLDDRLHDPQEAFDRSADLWDDHRYFEAYLHLVRAWRLDRAAGYRGLVMVAGGLCHVQRGNPAGAQALLRKGRSHLQATQPPGVDTPALLERVQAVLDALAGGDPPRLPDLPRVSQQRP